MKLVKATTTLKNAGDLSFSALAMVSGLVRVADPNIE